jgi:hypothetical protein
MCHRDDIDIPGANPVGHEIRKAADLELPRGRVAASG